MSSIVHALLDPIILLWIFLVLAIVFKKLNKIKLFRIFVIVSLIWLFIVTSSPLPQWLVFRLENNFSPLKPRTIVAPDKPTDILVLGGGHAIAIDLPATGQLTSSALARLTEAIRIHRQIPGSKIICSGYSVSKRTTHAETLGLAALELGVNPTDTLLMVRPSNTEEEAEEYVQRFGTGHQLIVVTSALHMKRALLYLQREGSEPIAAPANYFIKIDELRWKYDFIPDHSKVQMMDFALHEYAGLIKFSLLDNQSKK